MKSVSALVLVVTLGVTASCGGSCDQPCDPELVVRGTPQSGGFPDGTIEIEVTLGGNVTQCSIELPRDLGVVPCGDLRVAHERASVCEQTLEDDNLVLRCTMDGQLRQGIFIDEPTDTIQVREVYPDGTTLEETFTPDFVEADPERTNCDICPRTEVSWDLP